MFRVQPRQPSTAATGRGPIQPCPGAGEGARFAEPAARPPSPSLCLSSCSPSPPRGPTEACSLASVAHEWTGTGHISAPAWQRQGLRGRHHTLVGWLPRGGPLRLGEGAGGRVTPIRIRIRRHRHRVGCIQNSRANALAAGGRLLLSPNSSTQSIINTSPKAQHRHYGGSASHSGHHLLSRLQKLGK